jgi:hypothetical protein
MQTPHYDDLMRELGTLKGEIRAAAANGTPAPRATVDRVNDIEARLGASLFTY